MLTSHHKLELKTIYTSVYVKLTLIGGCNETYGAITMLQQLKRGLSGVCSVHGQQNIHIEFLLET
jgi:hypothetical protein